MLPIPLPSSQPPLLTFINDLEEDGSLVLKIILLGVLHMTGVFACVAEFQVPQQNGNVVHLLLSGTLQSDAIITFELHLGVGLFVLYRPVYELGEERDGEEGAQKESWSSRVTASLQPIPWVPHCPGLERAYSQRCSPHLVSFQYR